MTFATKRKKMPKYNSFAQFAKQQLTNIQNATDANKVLREAVVVTVPEMKRRIQNQGKRADGSEMQSRSKDKIGAYSRVWGTKRTEKGRQIGYIDLTFSGDMINDLRASPVSFNGYGIIFFSGDQFKKAQKMERLFGPIFDLSTFELQLSLAIINKKAQQLLSK